MERHDNNNNLLRRIKVRVADETITAVAGQKDTFTIAVINSAPSDSHRRSGNRPFPCHFYRRDSSPRPREVGLQIPQELRKRMPRQSIIYRGRVHSAAWGQAASVRDAFNALGDFQKAQIMAFLDSL